MAFFKRFFNPIHIIFLVSSMLMTTALYLLLSGLLLPYQLNAVVKEDIDGEQGYFYHDINHDGFSEKFSISNSMRTRKHLYLLFYNHNGDVKDQFTFYSPLKYENIFFNDLNGDRFDQCIVFTQQEDSLFLSVIDNKNSTLALFRYPILKAQKPYPYNTWDLDISDCQFFDINKDGWNECILSVKSGHSQHPRGIIVFDIKNRKILNSFFSNAAISQLIITDIAGDENKEIVALSNAVSNIKADPYNDNFAWIFVFDLHLNLAQKPMAVSESSTRLSGFIFPDKKNKSVVINVDCTADPITHGKIYILDSQGNLSLKQTFKENMTLQYQMIKLAGKDAIVYYSFGELYLFDNNFSIIQKKDGLPNRVSVLKALDLNGDSVPELITLALKTIEVYNLNFERIAAFDLEKFSDHSYLTIKNIGSKPAEIGFNTSEHFYSLRLSQNYLLTFLPLLLITAFALIFSGHILTHKIMLNLNIFISYFLFSLHKSKTAILLLSRNNRVYYFNNRLIQLLKTNQPIKKGLEYRLVFTEFPVLKNLLQEALKKGVKCEQEFSIMTGNLPVKGIVTVIPFKTRFNYHFATLIEFQDYTQQVLSDRQKTWSHTVRKLAHDIKTPLSSMQMSMDLIMQKLHDQNPQVSENLGEDFSLVREELARVKELTNQFLKFTNTENLNLQPVNLKDIIERSVNKFSSYNKADVNLKFSIQPETENIIADENQLELVFHIFIENAIDAIKGHGWINIDVCLAQDLSENFRKQVEIEISDSGPKIDEMILNHLFEPFFSTKKEGTGMGLVIAQKIVRDHYGSIEVQQGKTSGVVFRIILPFLTDKQKIIES